MIPSSFRVFAVIMAVFFFAHACCLQAATPPTSSSTVELSVPYVSQVPNGAWVAPWDQACEEASVAMVETYFANTSTTITKAETTKRMQTMIDWENKTFGKNDDTSADQTIQLIQTISRFDATIQRNPRLERIKTELQANRPVIFLVNMYDLYQESQGKDSYHVGVIVGFDDEKQEFIINDPAREGTRYSYTVLMGALHDYNPVTKEADGTPTVLFTAPRPAPSSSFMGTFFASVFAWIQGLFTW